MRTQIPFTSRQISFLKALNAKINDITNPKPDYITHISYQWKPQHTRSFGKIPKIIFSPHSCYIKAQVIREAGLFNEKRELELAAIRKQFGIKEQQYRHARLFESELNNIMLKIKKAVYTLGLINHLFTDDHSPMAEPIALVQQIVLEEQAMAFKD